MSSLLQSYLLKNSAPCLSIQPILKNMKGISPVVLSFLTQEMMNLPEAALSQLFELLNLDELTPSSLEPLRPLLLSLMLLSTSSKIKTQAKQMLNLLEKENKRVKPLTLRSSEP